MNNRPTEMDQFLTEPRIARISSINLDGTPHIVPVVYLFFPDKGSFYFNTKTYTLTIKNLRRNPKVSVCVDDGTHPFRAVTVSGIAHISEEMKSDHEGQKMLVDHFYGPEMWEEWIRSPKVKGIRVRVTIKPKKWKWWDQRRKLSGSVTL